MNHDARIGSIVFSFEEAMTRFRGRMSSADPAAAERVPAGGGWTPSQVAAHVAMVNTSFASILDGSRPAAQPAPEGFVERSWAAIAGGMPEKLEAPSRVHPPAEVSRDAAVELLAASETRLAAALRALDAERARLTIESPIVGGRVSLYQVGEWAVAHVIRHNKQVKRLLGGQDV
jgi:hypothetical protein